MERDAVHKAFMSLSRQDTKGNLISSEFHLHCLKMTLHLTAAIIL